MKVIGQDVLNTASRRDMRLRKWLQTWIRVVENSQWHNLIDLRKAYRDADSVTLPSGTVVTVFNVMGNNRRLLVWIRYDAQVVEVLEILTHAEYSKDIWKQRY
jgi:mRNA interferase HigB